MPFVTGVITDDGAVVVVRVGVSRPRQRRLQGVGLPSPEPVVVRAQIDTGSFVTAFSPSVFQNLEIQSFRTIPVRTPSTKPGEPCMCEQFDVSVILVSGTDEHCIPRVFAIASEDFDQERDGIQAILGRDILNRCAFNYYGPQQEFHLAF